MIDLDIAVEHDGWDAEPGLIDVLRRAASAAIRAASDVARGDVEATLLLAGDAEIRELNRAWRGQDTPTNVLSFPAPPHPAPQPGAECGERELGDIALAYETVAREAAAEGKTVRDHAAHLVVHGILHLLGADHDDDREAEEMERAETAALATLGIADPYRDTVA